MAVAHAALRPELARAHAIIVVRKTAAVGKFAESLNVEAAQRLLLPLALSLQGASHKRLLSAGTHAEHHAAAAGEPALESHALAVRAKATTTVRLLREHGAAATAAALVALLLKLPTVSLSGVRLTVKRSCWKPVLGLRVAGRCIRTVGLAIWV